jgi:hypothetical protein
MLLLRRSWICLSLLVLFPLVSLINLSNNLSRVNLGRLIKQLSTRLLYIPLRSYTWKHGETHQPSCWC